MNKSTSYIVAVLFAGAALSGCGSDPFYWDIEADTFGVKPLIEPKTFQKIDLAALLRSRSGDPNEKIESVRKKTEENKRLDIEEAYRTFAEKTDKKPDNIKERRNDVQERILAASVQRCGQYKSFIKSIDSRSNFALGTLTTAVGGAGAIFSGVSSALSATAAAISGIRAEFNQNYFANQTIQVLTTGMETRRAALYEAILDCQKLDYKDYPVQAAVKDAMEYHASCSLITGLEVAASAIQRVKNPGITEFEETYKRFKKITAMGDIPKNEAMIEVKKDQVAEAKKKVVKVKKAADGDKPNKELDDARKELERLEAELTAANKKLKLNEEIAKTKIRKLCKVTAKKSAQNENDKGKDKPEETSAVPVVPVKTKKLPDTSG